MTDKQVVAPDVAAVDFDRLMEAWDVDTEPAGMDADDRAGFEQQRRRIVRKIISGDATVDSTGDVLTYTLAHPVGDVTELEFKPPKGDAYTSFDQYKEKQGVHKLNSFMANMTGKAPKLFSQIDSRDAKFCQAAVALFFG